MTQLVALTCEHVQLHFTDSSAEHKVVEGAAAAIPCATVDTQADLTEKYHTE
jgi:hypothetical protein